MYMIGGAFTLFLFIHLTEGRVYCQDTHASPWIPLGYTCPVMCQNILNAIERLKIIDYRKLIEEESRNRMMINDSYVENMLHGVGREATSGKTDNEISNDKKFQKMWRHKNKSLRYQKYFKDIKIRQNGHEKDTFKNDYFDIDNRIELSAGKHDKMAAKQNSKSELEKNGDSVDIQMKKEITEALLKYHKDFDRELVKALENRTCDWYRSKAPYVMIKKIMRCGSRRYGYGEDFLRTLTRTMNRFSKASFEFTEDMVELVLERVFGKNLELNKEVFDLGKLFHYLRNAMEMHKQHKERDTIIVLKPRHCLSISMPGCFCRPGFVESSGQCVEPADCVPDSSNRNYLSRIVVH